MNVTDFQLGKYDLKTAKLFRAAASEEQGEAKWAAEYEAVKACVGDAALLAETLDGEGLESVDLSVLDELFVSIKDYYEAPAIKASMSALDGLDLSKLSELSAQMERINALTAKRVGSRQGFRRV